MTERVKKYLEFHLSRSYRQNRKDVDFSLEKYKNLDENLYAAEVFSACAESEEPLFYENYIFGFNRGCVIKAEDAKAWKIDNITPNYSTLIDNGTENIRKRINSYMTVADEKQNNFYAAVLKVLDSFEKLADRYKAAAKEQGKTELYSALCKVPRKAASTFYEACLYQKMITFMLRLINPWHITLGRFDQYMYKYFLADKEKGKSTEELFEILELYFISLNFDTDIYGGVQQGDNGQSLVLGGYDLDGMDAFNELSELCINASCELCLIDPKINLRVSKKTPRERYQLATKLTKMGLGFPQYSNDDIVIPALIKLGYAPEDAANYSVAACWEFIVPGKGLDVPNAENICVPRHVNNAIIKSLKASDTFEDLLKAAEDEIGDYIEHMIEDKRINRSYTVYQNHPFLSLMVDGCIEQGTDLKYVKGCYRNFGSHSTGLSVAADALAAVKKVIYEDKTVDKDRLLAALKTDYEKDPELRNLLISCPKVGNDDNYADSLMVHIMKFIAKKLNRRPNGHGGIWRSATGSAQNYYYAAKDDPATADGRKAYTPYPSSYSPTLTAKLSGPLSVIRSFTKPDLTESCNGGPLTMEVHDNVFRNLEGEGKVADMVKLFIDMGGHQLQLNAINRERLLDAQKHPENYPNLVVRVWGWSGYFVELDPAFQNHIISRTNFTF